MQIERVFTKDQIFQMYANQIYLGHGTYGFEAASEYYFSKHVGELTLPEAALLAALPKGAEYYSPVNHPERALRRRNLVLSEMLADRKITREQEEAAEATPLGLKIEPPPNSVAPYFVEEVRQQLEKEYGAEEVQGAGLKVYTTLDLDLQLVANKAVLDGTAAYERRHGWKGNLQNVAAAGSDLETYKHPDWAGEIETGGYYHALVTEAAPERVMVKIGPTRAVMTPADWAWTQKTAGDSFLRVGDVVYVRLGEGSADGVQHARTGAGLGRAGVADGGGQLERRGAGDGGRAGLRAVAVQPGDAVGARGGFVVQAVCVYHGGGGGGQADGHDCGWAGELFRRPTGRTRRTTTRATTRGRSPC